MNYFRHWAIRWVRLSACRLTGHKMPVKMEGIQHVGHYHSARDGDHAFCGGRCSGGHRDRLFCRSSVVQAHLMRSWLRRVILCGAFFFCSLSARAVTQYITIMNQSTSPLYLTFTDDTTGAVTYCLIQAFGSGNNWDIVPIDSAHTFNLAGVAYSGTSYTTSVYNVPTLASVGVNTRDLIVYYFTGAPNGTSNTVEVFYGSTLAYIGHSAKVWEYIFDSYGGLWLVLGVGFFVGWYMLSPLDRG